MKFFVVDNGSRHLSKICDRLADHEYETVTYTPFTVLDPGDADMIILSGGMQNEVIAHHEDGYPWYRHEFDLIRNTDKPILGICLGLQMVTVALGGSLIRLPEFIDKQHKVVLNHQGQKLLSEPFVFVQEKHQWVASGLEKTGLHVLAHSEDGIEIVYHPERHIIATQFHPEVDTNEHSEAIFWKFVDAVARKKIGAVR